MLPVIMINKQELFTIPLMVNNLSNSFRSDYGAIMARSGAVCSAYDRDLQSLFQNIYQNKGIAAGAVKG